jgi:hypothetical protein
MRQFALIIALLLAAPCFAQTVPQLDMQGGLVSLPCSTASSWINTTVTSGAVTGSLTPQNITLANATGVVAGNWLTIDPGAPPVTVVGETHGTVASGTQQYLITLNNGDVLPGTILLKVNGVIVAEDKGPLGRLTQNQTGMLVDIGLITTGTTTGAMQAITGGISGSGGTSATAYANMLSVQWADPTPSSVHTAVQEFANVVFTSAFATAHNGQAITFDYQYSPAEMFVVPSLTGSQLNGVVLMNHHAANAVIATGLPFVSTPAITIGGVSAGTAVQCDALGFANRQYALYSVDVDTSDGTADSHWSGAFRTTASLVDGVNTGISDHLSHVITPASMAGICNNCIVTIAQGLAAEEHVQATSVTGTTFTATFQNTQAAGFGIEGYHQYAVAFGAQKGGGGHPTVGSTTGKYFGNADIWGPLNNIELKGWGFNLIQFFGSNHADPLYVENANAPFAIKYPTADNSQLEKMPAVQTIDATFRASSNSSGRAGQSGCGGGVAGANGNTDFSIKNVWTTWNGSSAGAHPGNLFVASFGDIYDPNLYAWLCGDLIAGVGSMTGGGHENPWYLYQEDEGDFLDSFSNSKRPGFAAHGGTYEDVGPRKDLFMPYHLSASLAGTGNYVAFSNNLNNLKSNLISTLQTEYPASGTEPSCAGAAHGIAALNACWGSSYDNFGTDGTQVTGVALSPLPDGTTTTFTATLANAPDRGSIQLFGSLAAGVSPILAGDLPGGGKSTTYTSTGTFKGPSASNISSSSITYSTGAISVTFSVAPASSANALTVNYWWGGWGVGHGLADEDGTCPAFSGSCATVYGTNCCDITADGNASFQADIITLLGDMVSYFSTNEKTQYRTLVPHTLILSDYAIGSFGVPTDPVVYQNYCPNVDILGSGGLDVGITNTGGFGPQGISPQQYVNHYCGATPIVFWTGPTAPADSQMSVVGCGPNGQFTTQVLRAGYTTGQIASYDTVLTTTGTRTALGLNFWNGTEVYAECSSAGDGGQFGLKDEHDNPYDGVLNTTTAGFELIGNNALATTPDSGNWGNFLGTVTPQITTSENNLLGTSPPTFLIQPNKNATIWGLIPQNSNRVKGDRR